MHRRSLLLGASALAAVSSTTPVLAQLVGKMGSIVTGSAGSPYDVVARILADRMKPEWAPNTQVINRPGGAGLLSVGSVQRAAPDGLTMVFTPSQVMVMLPHAFTKGPPPFHPLEDFVAVAYVGEIETCLVVETKLPVRNVREYLDAARRDPKQGSYGTAGATGAGAFVAYRLAQLSGVELTAVPYPGGQQSLQAVMGGQIPSAMVSLDNSLVQFHQQGLLRIIATSGAERSPLTPDIPTFREQGFQDIAWADWTALYAPARTPPEEVERINRIVANVLKDSTVTTTLARYGMKLGPSMNPAQLRTRLVGDYEKWRPVVKDTGFSLD